MELRDYVKVARRRWRIVLGLTLVAVVFAGVGTSLQTREYASSARLFISTSDTDQAALFQGGQFSAERVKSYADLINSRELATRVVHALDLDTDPARLAQQVQAKVSADTVNLTLTVRDRDPAQAQSLAQGYSEALVDLVRELETPPGQTAPPVKATIVDSASYSDVPVSPQPVRNIGLALVLGLLLGYGAAVARELSDTRVRNPDELGAIADAPIMGTFQLDNTMARTPLITDLPPHSPRGEAYRVLRTNLQFVDVDARQKTLVITSALPGEGKSTTAANLALSFAQAGASTLLLDCDLRRPRVATYFGLDGAIGVTSVLAGLVKPEDALQHHDASGLALMAAGPIPPNPAELLQSGAMQDLLARYRTEYDVILLDAPPLLPVADAALLAAQADGAMVVVSHGRVSRDQVAQAADRLAQVSGRLVGFVLNRTPGSRKRGGYGYGYGYGYEPERAAAGVHRGA